jgi:hypothetical protein
VKIDHKSLGLLPPLPGGIDAPAGEALAAEAFPAAFGPRLPHVPEPQVDTWRQLLALDVPAASQRTMGPPPAPAGIDAEPMTSRRLQFKRLIRRHERWLNAHPGKDGESDAVAGMLALLANYQDFEDAIVARQISESRS